MNYDIPIGLKRMINGREMIRNNKGWSESEVFLLKGVAEKGDCYLKIAPNNQSSYITSEKSKLDWLRDKLAVPEVYYFEISNGYEYLLISSMPGKDALSTDILQKPYSLVRAVACGLKKIHSIEIADCPFSEKIEDKLELIKSMYKTKRTSKLYNFLIENKPLNEDLVFTHGDYCFPNIIIKDENISGFIDLGRSGIGDRYVDLSLIIRSIMMNYKSDKLLNLFLEEYGLKNIDYEKLKYYSYLDKLIN